MTPQTLVEWQKELRSLCDSKMLDTLERLLNATKGQGATTILSEAAQENKAILITHSEEWANQLKAWKPRLNVVGFENWSPSSGRKILFDNGLFFLCVRQSQRIRIIAEGLLNYLEQHNIKEKK